MVAHGGHDGNEAYGWSECHLDRRRPTIAITPNSTGNTNSKRPRTMLVGLDEARKPSAR